jgi:L-fuculose-phosphate aldolase
MNEWDLRKALVKQGGDLEKAGVNQGTSGNFSARCGASMLITPSGVPYDLLTPDMIAAMPLEHDYGTWSGPLPPSSEWRFHLDIMRARPEVGAVIHTHSVYATTLSLLHMSIPPTHYMIAAFGGPSIRCTDYAPYGTKELSDLALAGLTDRTGVLLGQHGMLVVGRDLEQAAWRAVELETLAKMYYLARAIGTPKLLSDAEVMRIVERFKNYGYRRPDAADGIDTPTASEPLSQGRRKPAVKKPALKKAASRTRSG